MQQTCMLCTSRHGGDLGLCAPCMADLPWHQTAQCPQCALAINDNLYGGGLCGGCLSEPPSFDATRATFTYNYPLDGLLQHYKYNASLNLARTFATLWLDAQRAQVTSMYPIDLIIPMPMHEKRLTERGFNQALEIAKHFSRAFTIPLDYSSCQRIKYTPPQASLKLKERISNMRGAFHCQPSLHNLNIAVVDDVMTTGTSLNELAKTLKQAGAARVECWVMARTLPK
ncbi:ComF family protein [Methylotenera mobilis]|nr:ComF family protein [Methylotenera mobilis]